MAVFITRKSDEYSIKNYIAIVRTTFSLLIVRLWETKGQVILM